MEPMTRATSYARLVALLDELYGSVTEAVSRLDAGGFLRPTRASAWSVQDLLFHQMLDTQRALRAFATPSTSVPDVDAVTYWRPFRPDAGDGGVAHARFVRIAASAYAQPEEDLVWHWRETAAAAVGAARAADPDASIQTQGHVLTVPDFVHTLVVEATVHLLDLALEIEVAAPPAEALQLVREVLDGLLGEPVTVDWDDTEYALKGTGREPLSASDLSALGGQVQRFPLLG